MDAARALAAKHGATASNIVSDPNAERFYLAAGGVRIGERASESIPGRYLPEFEIPLG